MQFLLQKKREFACLVIFLPYLCTRNRAGAFVPAPDKYGNSF